MQFRGEVEIAALIRFQMERILQEFQKTIKSSIPALRPWRAPADLQQAPMPERPLHEGLPVARKPHRDPIEAAAKAGLLSKKMMG